MIFPTKTGGENLGVYTDATLSVVKYIDDFSRTAYIEI